MAHLRHTYRTLHRPEMRIRQRDINGLQGERMAHLPPVGGDHIGCGRQASCATELSHHFTPGETLLCNFAFFSGLIGAQFWAERAQPKSPELDAKLLASC